MHLAAGVQQLREGEGGGPGGPAQRSQPQPVDPDRSSPLPQTAVIPPSRWWAYGSHMVLGDEWEPRLVFWGI